MGVEVFPFDYFSEAFAIAIVCRNRETKMLSAASSGLGRLCPAKLLAHLGKRLHRSVAGHDEAERALRNAAEALRSETGVVKSVPERFAQPQERRTPAPLFRELTLQVILGMSSYCEKLSMWPLVCSGFLPISAQNVRLRESAQCKSNASDPITCPIKATDCPIRKGTAPS